MIVRPDSSASYGAETVRWRIMGDSLALALGGEWVNYRLKLKGRRLTLSGGDLTEPVTFDRWARRHPGPIPSRSLRIPTPSRFRGESPWAVTSRMVDSPLPYSANPSCTLPLPAPPDRRQRLRPDRPHAAPRRTPPAEAPAPRWRGRRPLCCTAGSGAPAPRPPSPGWCSSASSSAAARLDRWPAGARDPALHHRRIPAGPKQRLRRGWPRATIAREVAQQVADGAPWGGPGRRRPRRWCPPRSVHRHASGSAASWLVGQAW